MTAPTPHGIKLMSIGHIEPTPHKAPPFALSTGMLEALGDLTGIKIHKDQLQPISQFTIWWEDSLERLGKVAHEIFTFAQKSKTQKSQPEWVTLGLSLLQLFSDHFEKLPTKLQSSIQDITKKNTIIQKILIKFQKNSEKKLLSIVHGFINVLHLKEITSSKNTTTTKTYQPTDLQHQTLLNIYQNNAYLSKMFELMFGELKEIKSKFSQKEIPEINALLSRLEKKINALTTDQKYLPIKHGSHITGNTDASTGESGENTIIPSVSKGPHDFNPFYLPPTHYVVLSWAYIIVNAISKNVKQVVETIIDLTLYYDILGRCVGRLLQQYQQTWQEITPLSTDWEKLSTSLELAKELESNPQLLDTLAPPKSIYNWIKNENQAEFIDQKSQTYTKVLDALKTAWDPQALTTQLHSVKEDLIHTPEEISPEWIQNAWQEIDKLIEFIDLISDSIESLVTEKILNPAEEINLPFIQKL
jgi:hypothetical protein